MMSSLQEAFAASLTPCYPTSPAASWGPSCLSWDPAERASTQAPPWATPPRPDHFCWVSCLFLWGLSPKYLNSFNTKITGLFFFNNPWKWSQLKKEWNSTFSQIQLLNNLNESYLSLLKTTPTLCSLMWTEKKKKLCTNVQNLSPCRWPVLHHRRLLLFWQNRLYDWLCKGFPRLHGWQAGLWGFACG